MIPTGWSSTSSVLSAIALGRAHVLSAVPGGWGCAGRSRCENGKAPVCLFIYKVVQREQIGQSVRRDHTVHSRSTAATATPKIQGNELPTAPHPWNSWASSKSWRPLCEPAPPLRGRPQSEDEMAVRSVEGAHHLRRRLHGLLRGGGSITTLHYL